MVHVSDRWKDAARGWLELLDRIAHARHELRCSFSHAWFRGQADATWALRPSLLRIADHIDMDRHAKIVRIQKELSDIGSRLKSIAQRLHNNKAQFWELAKTKGVLATDPAAITLRLLLSGTHDELRIEKAQINARLTALQTRKACLEGLHYGELDAYNEWRVRTGSVQHSSSWLVLADMQHYSVPTRLLDWTSTLSTGLFFAVGKYVAQGEKAGCFRGGNDEQDKLFDVTRDLPEPALWILNPYLLTREAAKRNTIGDLTLDPALDYHRAFLLENTWPYARPLPALIPWRNPRIDRQEGRFTVHGQSSEPLEAQSDALQRIAISRDTAVYAARHLKTFLDMDQFSLYRDLDSLGHRVRDRFLIPRHGPH
ncbi:MAG TPA: FRG domain-containing protein [Kofleriaceae bacterium]|nr:FRG domain-containing protein [Kofleriaceae bacterium]